MAAGALSRRHRGVGGTTCHEITGMSHLPAVVVPVTLTPVVSANIAAVAGPIVGITVIHAGWCVLGAWCRSRNVVALDYALSLDKSRGWLLNDRIAVIVRAKVASTSGRRIVLGVMIWQQLPSSALTILGLLLGINLIFSGFTFVMLAMSGPAASTAAT